MPEMLPTYERFCALAQADALAARFLTGYQPPAYVSACSQAVLTQPQVQLVRNYEYHHHLIEGTLLLSAWNGKRVIANSDCLVGVVDGMNEDGLVISLTFGGRRVVGVGFGIPFILRYVLEFARDLTDALAMLTRIPAHMAYNVTVMDRSGRFHTVELSPDQAPLVTERAYATNHQAIQDWPENAHFNRTYERAAFLEGLLAQPGLSPEAMAEAFLRPPLYNTRFDLGFGTLYTTLYQPASGQVILRWPEENMQQSFDHFIPGVKVIDLQPEMGELDLPALQQPNPIWNEVGDLVVPASSATKVSIPAPTPKPKRPSWRDHWAKLSRSYWKK
jgi:predicted choloylglycine hydrolase